LFIPCFLYSRFFHKASSDVDAESVAGLPPSVSGFIARANRNPLNLLCKERANLFLVEKGEYGEKSCTVSVQMGKDSTINVHEVEWFRRLRP